MKQLILLLFFPLLTSWQSTSNDDSEASKETATTKDTVTQAAKPETSAALDQAYAMGFDTLYLMGKFDPAEHPDFIQIPSRYADREGLFLRKDTYEAFLKMYEAAKAEGVTLVIRSATRNFNYQKGIWERKWTGQRKLSSGENAAEAYPDPKDRALAILQYSSMPGTSRHHWGTDIDLNAFNNGYFEKGQGKLIYEWLNTHAADFGFCQPYTPKGSDRPNGYNEEKWHWSYLPVAQPLTALAKKELENGMISGFKGAETAKDINVVTNYILGINNLCISN